MKKSKRQNRTPSLLPKGKKELRRVELLGGTAFGVAVCLIVVVFFAANAQRFFLGLPQTAAVITAILVDLANGDRAANSLGRLAVNPKLVAAAQAKANDMARGGYFAHVSPEGKDPWYWFKEAGYSFTHAGENLAVDFSDSVDVEKAWMNSPAHRENILDARYTQIGIATAVGTYQGHETIFVVQEFGTPAAVQVAVPTQAAEPLEQEIAVQDVPATPTKIATAAAPEPSPEPREAPTPEPEQVLGTAKAAQISAPAADVAPPLTTGPVGYALASPRTSLQYAYIAIGIFLLAALAYMTRFEMKKHHLRHVKAAVLLVLLMGAILLAANYFVFSAPTIPSGGASVMRGP